jgi:putative membrane protein
MLSRKTYLLTLLAAYSVWWVVMAINPLDRADWLLENVLVVIGIALLIWTYDSFPLSRISYTCIFIFMLLHTLGSHYTYAKVPYQEWIPYFEGGRNHFDRLVHFLYGLLLAYPIREMFLRIGNVRGFWGYFLPLDLTMSTSMLYELIEWGAAEAFGGDLGAAYLGTQGDIWDAHKDMSLASLGALIAMTVTALINRHMQRDFAREWADSIRVKRKKPLGEEAIVKSI